MNSRFLTFAPCGLLATTTSIVRAAGQSSAAAERFTAFAVNMGDPGPARSGTVDIVVTRWSIPSQSSNFA